MRKLNAWAVTALLAVLPVFPCMSAAQVPAPSQYPATIDGRRIDSLGLLPGMTPDEARAAVAKLGFVQKDYDEKAFSYRKDDVLIWRSPGFTSQLIFEKPGAVPVEQVAAEFTSTLSGNQLVTARWTLDWEAPRAPLNWTVKQATDFMVGVWGRHSGFYVPDDEAYSVYWYRFTDGRIALCPGTGGGMSETCGEWETFGGPHSLAEVPESADLIMRVVMWTYDRKVFRFEHVVDDFKRRVAARKLEQTQIDAAVEHTLAGGDRPAAKPKPAFTGFDMPGAVTAKEKAAKPAPVENISTERAGSK